MRTRRKIEGFNLAFLDIMSCGLGAVILLLMLVKQDVQTAHVEVELLQADLSRLASEETALREQLMAVASENGAEEARIATASSRLAAGDAALAQARQEIAAQQAQRQALQRTIEQTDIPKQPDSVEVPRVGEETYLIGLRVEGRRIALLVDASASMTDERLIDIIRRKNASDAERMNGPKWQRTRRIVDWLVARAPAESEISIVTFAGSAVHLGGVGWKPARDPGALRGILDEFASIVPQGATNLQAGLRAVAALQPTDVYIVTDGLPTAGDSGYKSLNPFSGCSALWGGSSTISGECRARLFVHSVQGTPLAGVRLNVVLLPVEGDPDASALFWRWTAQRQGVTISPAETWP